MKYECQSYEIEVPWRLTTALEIVCIRMITAI